MSFKFKKINLMDESHLCNTVSCESPRVSDERQWECREELMKRWANQQRPYGFESKYKTSYIDNNINVTKKIDHSSNGKHKQENKESYDPVAEALKSCGFVEIEEPIY